MGQRKNLHQILSDIMVDTCGSSASAQVYFQPPETIKMVYPCIVYERDTGDTQFADNAPYIHNVRYTVTVIDRNPDSEIPAKVAMLSMTIYDRHFTSDNLHHDVYKIYY
ncbi:MAG: hypothetical protein LIP10_03485 [Clostridiales bacterium]|nr:hypothetical protein [Clostridiales bacterium]